MMPDNVLSDRPAPAQIIGARANPDITARFDQEDGGVALQDPSQGLMYQTWTAEARDGGVWLSAPNFPAQMIRAGNITECSIAFDRAMNWVLAFVEDGVSKLSFYSNLDDDRIEITLNGTNPRVIHDDKREGQSDVGEVLVTYVRDETLYQLRQRDRYGEEFHIGGANIKRLVKVGMGSNLRLQFVALTPDQPGPVPVDKTGLLAALDDAAVLDEADYTPESWAVLASAVAAGQAVYDDPDATQQQVDDATQAINSAIDDLVPVAESCTVALTHDILAVEPAYMPADIDGQVFSITSPTTTGDYAASTALADLKPLPASGIMWVAFRKDADDQCAFQIADAATLTTITFVPQGGDEWWVFYLGTATTVSFEHSGQAVMVGIGSDGAVYAMLDDASVVSVADMTPVAGTMPEFPLAGATGLAFVGVVRGNDAAAGTVSAEFITRAEGFPQLPGGEAYDWCGNALPEPLPEKTFTFLGWGWELLPDNPGTFVLNNPDELTRWYNEFVPTAPDISAVTPPAGPVNASEMLGWINSLAGAVVDHMTDGQVFGFAHPQDPTGKQLVMEYRAAPAFWDEFSDFSDPIEFVTLSQAGYAAVELRYGLRTDETVGEWYGEFINDTRIGDAVGFGFGTLIFQVDEAAPAPDLPTEIGQAFGGGYYIGDITVADGGPDDGTYAVIMAGPESGDAVLMWKTTNSATDGAQSTSDGRTNTENILGQGVSDHPAASYAADYAGGGNSDWYLPAAGEAELIYQSRAILDPLLQFPKNAMWSSTAQAGSGGLAYQVSLVNATGAVGNFKIRERLVRPVRRIRKG